MLTYLGGTVPGTDANAVLNFLCSIDDSDTLQIDSKGRRHRNLRAGASRILHPPKTEIMENTIIIVLLARKALILLWSSLFNLLARIICLILARNLAFGHCRLKVLPHHLPKAKNWPKANNKV
jgi:hypothetical protein